MTEKESICAKCPERELYLSKLRLISYYICKVCGCPIATKTRFGSQCPLGKW